MRSLPARRKAAGRHETLLEYDSAVLAGRYPPISVSQPRIPDTWWLCLRRDLMGRIQHRDGGDQHRELLCVLSRNAHQRVRGDGAVGAFLEPVRGAGDLL